MKRLTKEDILASKVEPRPSGHAMLLRFVRAHEAGEVPSKQDMDDLSDRLQSILEGVPADKALGLTRPRGRQVNALTSRQLDRKSEAAARVKYRMWQFGESHWQAAEALVSELAMGRTTIIKAFDGYEQDGAARYMFTILKKFSPLPHPSAKKRRANRGI